MTWLYRETVKCAVCQTESEQIAVASVSSFGPPDLDMRSPGTRGGSMNAWLQECPGCHFVARDLSTVSAEETAVRKEAGYIEAGQSGELPDLARRFMRSAYIEERAGRAKAAIQRLLHAAWALDDRKLGASSVRMRAADMIRSLGADAEIDLQLLRLDMLRRAGAFVEAVEAADELLTRQLDPFHRKVAIVQRRAALEEKAEVLPLTDAANEPDPA